MRSSRFNRNVPARLPRDIEEEVRAGGPFDSRAALSAGVLSRHALATRYTQIVPCIYAASDKTLSRWDEITAVSKWAPNESVVAGWAAAHVQGERWYSTGYANRRIDIYSTHDPRAPALVRWRRPRRPLTVSDQIDIGGITVTSPARTAVDVARWAVSVDDMVCAVDSVCNATGTPIAAVEAAAERMRGLHGVRRVASHLSDCDPRADSPQDTLVRLRIARSPLPAPVSQLRIRDADGRKIATADLGYPEWKVAIFYDGSHHGNPEQWRWDLRVNARLADLGWQVVRITAGMSAEEVVQHVSSAVGRATRTGTA